MFSIIITRRFIVISVVVFLIAIGSGGLSSADTLDGKPISTDDRQHLSSMIEREAGKFSFLIVTDLHFTMGGAIVDKQTMIDIKKMIKRFKPEALVVTGDMVSNNPNHQGQKVLERAVADMGKLGIPWIYAWGNHDQMDDYEIAHKTLEVGKNSLYRGGLTDGNYRVEILDKATGAAVWNLIVVNDSRGGFKADQLAWFKSEIGRIFNETPTPPPSIALMHIPIKEINDVGVPGKAVGVKFENSCPEDGMTGSIDAFAEAGVKAIFFGHDHVSDFYGTLKGVRLQYARSTGYEGYGADKMRKGGTLVTIDTNKQTFETVSVFPDGATWIPDGFITTPETDKRY